MKWNYIGAISSLQQSFFFHLIIKSFSKYLLPFIWLTAGLNSFRHTCSFLHKKHWCVLKFAQNCLNISLNILLYLPKGCLMHFKNSRNLFLYWKLLYFMSSYYIFKLQAQNTAVMQQKFGSVSIKCDVISSSGHYEYYSQCLLSSWAQFSQKRTKDFKHTSFSCSHLLYSLLSSLSLL